MHFTLDSFTGLTSVILSLPAFAQLSAAWPAASYDVVPRGDLSIKPTALYHEHKHQRLYRNDDSGPYVQPAALRAAKIKPRKAGAPRVRSKKFLGNSPAMPEQEYIDSPTSPPPALPASLYQPTANRQLSQSPKYSSIYEGSGSLTYNRASKSKLKKLRFKPRMSRDGGQGGKIGGKNVFIFADTETYSPSGEWTGFVSNSVALNNGKQRGSGKGPRIHDKLGEWCNSEGTMRNFIPFTIGEAAYNAKMAGLGQRYAIWPQSSVIPLDSKSALLYAPIVFANTADPKQQFQNTGVTLVKVTVPGKGGPVAERLNPLLFHGDPEVEWGVLGGIHGHGPDGTDGGKVYIFGNHKSGLMLARVDAAKAAERDAYEFWHKGGSWTSDAPSKGSNDNFVDGAFSYADIFYSPHHKTFIMVFMEPYMNNNFYWQYLKTPEPIEPSSSDFVENITKHQWSEPEELFSIPNVPADKFAYSGGMYRGYFDDKDISAGGTKMLIGWAQPTGLEASSEQTAFQHMSAEITFE